MEQITNLTKEESNRVSVWSLVLFKICNYCVVCEEQRNNRPLNLKDEDWGVYYVRGLPCYYLPYSIIEDGLLEASIIGLSSIFNSGGAGDGIVNNFSNNIIRIREELLIRTSKKMGHTDSTYLKNFIRKLKRYRDQLIAHYDGSIAEYEEVWLDGSDGDGNINGRIPEVTKMKAPMVHFSQMEITELKDITIKMQESLIDILHVIDGRETLQNG